MPFPMCSAMTAGLLPSTTQAIDGAGLVGSCGAANTAPSGLSAAVTRSAPNGRAIGASACSGPDVGRGDTPDPAAAVVEVDEAAGVVVAAPPWWVVAVAEGGVDGDDAHAASTNPALINVNPHCRRRPGFLRTGPV